MSLRDRPKLSDRLRGKSGDELINEIKKEFEDNKKNWFSKGNSGFNSFKRVRKTLLLCIYMNKFHSIFRNLINYAK